MRIKIPNKSAEIEVAGVKYAIVLHRIGQSIPFPPFGRIYAESSNPCDRVPLSTSFETYEEADRAISTGFTIEPSNNAQEIAQALLDSGKAEISREIAIQINNRTFVGFVINSDWRRSFTKEQQVKIKLESPCELSPTDSLPAVKIAHDGKWLKSRVIRIPTAPQFQEIEIIIEAPGSATLR